MIVRTGNLSISVANTCIPGTQEAEKGRDGVLSQPGLGSEQGGGVRDRLPTLIYNFLLNAR